MSRQRRTASLRRVPPAGPGCCAHCPYRQGAAPDTPARDAALLAVCVALVVATCAVWAGVLWVLGVP